MAIALPRGEEIVIAVEMTPATLDDRQFLILNGNRARCG